MDELPCRSAAYLVSYSSYHHAYTVFAPSAPLWRHGARGTSLPGAAEDFCSSSVGPSSSHLINPKQHSVRG